MAERVRFHLDENVDPAVAAALRRRGIDVTTSQETGLLRHRDEEQLEFARAQRRAIVTHDADLLHLATEYPDHWGIAFCEMNTRSIGEIMRGLALIHEIIEPAEMRGRIEYL